MQRSVVDNRYELIEPLGSGGMANVYLAHDDVLDRDVAIKVLREQYANDEEFVGRFRREAQSAAKLSHPNIVQIYDWGRSENGAYYIAMEYVPRGTLKDRIVRDGALSPAAATGVALQISDALSAAHEQGVIHRDIKPQNVLVTRTGDLKVTDFGIARAASSSQTATDVVLGTAGYMSPEQAMGKPVGPQSDLYSLGVVLYEMLAGALPYDAESPVAQAMMHVNQPPRSPREANPEVPEALDALTVKLLAKNPEDRYPSASALADDLERVSYGVPPATASVEKTEVMAAPLLPNRGDRTSKTAVRPPSAAPVRSPESGGRRRGRLLPVLAALLLALVLIGGLALSERFDLTGLGGRDEQKTGASETNVPDVTGYSVEYAVAALEGAGFEIGNRRQEPSDTILAGLVTGTDPAVGVRAREGDTVDVYISTGPAQVPGQGGTGVGAVGGNAQSGGGSESGAAPPLQQVPAQPSPAPQPFVQPTPATQQADPEEAAENDKEAREAQKEALEEAREVIKDKKDD